MPKSLKIKVIPQQGGGLEPGRILGYDMFPDLYANIFLCARKNSGKTTAIYNILRHCANKNTTVYFFVSTVNLDSSYKGIMEYLDSKSIPYEKFIHFKEDGVNHLHDILGPLRTEEEHEAPPPAKVKFENEEEEEVKPKKIAPERIFIFDDLSSDMRDKSVTNLLKYNRHYKCKVILSSQSVTDLEPDAKAQLSYVLIFAGFNLNRLERLHKELALSNELPEFVELYLKATEKKYSFLYIDVRDVKYRVNFDEPIEV